MKLFGTDGIRGTVNKDFFTPELVLRLGMASASVLRNEHGRNMVLVGKDTRLSGYMIETALVSGICAKGVNVTLVGPLPTPGIAYLTRALRLDAGFVISASHNPFDDNGIKIFSPDGFKISDELEERIEQRIADPEFPRNRAIAKAVGKAFRLDDATGRYIEYVKSSIPRKADLEGLKVVVDTANGSAYKVTPVLLRELGADVISINDEPNGININDNCGSLHLQGLIETVLKEEADIGVAHDGDADRTLFVDNKGNVVDGDMVLAICGYDMMCENRLQKNTIVATVMTNFGVQKWIEAQGMQLVRTDVGDRYVVEEMRKNGYNLGGEQSGHIVFFDYNTTGDGPITALQVLHLIHKKERTLAELVSSIPRYPQKLVNVRVKDKSQFEAHAEIALMIKKAQESLQNQGRILVRPSGTEPKIRVMVEATTEQVADTLASEIAEFIAKKMS